MICKKYIFGHSDDQNILLSWCLSRVPASQLQKPLKFSRERVLKMPCFMLMGWLLKALRSPKDGSWLLEEPTTWLVLELSGPASTPPGWGEGLETELSFPWPIILLLQNLLKSPKGKTPKSFWVNTWRWKEGGITEEGKPCASSHIPCPGPLFHLTAPELFSFIINQLPSE